MSKINDGGPAFPVIDCGHGVAFAAGMTLRDYFAAKVMPTMFRCWAKNDDGTADMLFEFERDCEFIAQDCYVMADAMIRERNKENAGPTTG